MSEPTIYRDFAQYSPDWWRVRRGVPTASEFKRIITPTGKPCEGETMRGYINQLIGDRLRSDYGNEDDANDYQSAAMKNGTLMEPAAIDYYEARRDAKIERVAFVVSACGRFGCSPDALVGDDGGLESKSPGAKKQVERMLMKGVDSDLLAQCHGSMIVTGRKWWDAMSYHGDLPTVLHRVTPNDYTDALRVALDAFWTRYEEAWAKVVAMLPEPMTTPQMSDEEAAMSMFTGR